MDESLNKQLRYLGLNELSRTWDSVLKEAITKKPSYQSFLHSVVENEYLVKTEKARQARLKRAKIPEAFVLETFPFNLQPKLDRKRIRELHDDMSFIREKQDLVFMGPTGCGKTGLATSFLVQAISKGYRGLFTDFSNLIDRLYQARGDRSENNLARKLASIDVLLIDELGYISCDREQASLFFDLMRRRVKKTTTIITTQLGFEEWGTFLHDAHITAALLDRITISCNVFNMKQCISIRPKKIRNMTVVTSDKDKNLS
jgi:DNA replication protein DnaC